jgi:hypothetical protein
LGCKNQPDGLKRLLAEFAAQKRVVTTLFTKGRHWPMARDEINIIPKREELLMNGANQRAMIATREVSAPD